MFAQLAFEFPRLVAFVARMETLVLATPITMTPVASQSLGRFLKTVWDDPMVVVELMTRGAATPPRAETQEVRDM
jgi:hypothetical protein